jgi:hypothetical protein
MILTERRWVSKRPNIGLGGITPKQRLQRAA